MITLQEIIKSIENLPKEDREYLFDFLQKQRINQKQNEILTNAEELKQAFKNANEGDRTLFEDIYISYLDA
ncbi:MAG: hypothetical protein RPG89_01870 [Microcystis panniformis WG22]|nr:hypothetical protein [Microcystis panniformis WG22]